MLPENLFARQWLQSLGRVVSKALNVCFILVIIKSAGSHIPRIQEYRFHGALAEQEKI